MTCPVVFHLDAVDRGTGARAGRLELARGVVHTPVFMPVGTQAAIRSLPPTFLPEIGVEILLANTYHLHQRPGEAIVEKLGGLHRFMAVETPILTDSGGFQVFSLDKKEVSEDGVSFSYELDGKTTFLSPERSMEIQQRLGADIAMAFDECLPPGVSHADTATSVDLTARWAARSLAAHTRPDQSLFGIVQGGLYPDLRRRSVEQITSLGFDGFAIGGLSVGEGPDIMNEVLQETTPLMPAGLPRYLMGVGRPQDLVDGIAVGVDMFDCVIPTRHARSGTLYTFQGRIRITHARYRRDAYPVDTSCPCYTCRTFSRAYLHHLMTVGEVLSATLCTIHNLTFFRELMTRARQAIADGTFAAFRRTVKDLYPETDGAGPSDEAVERQREARERMAVEPVPGRKAGRKPARKREAAARAPARPREAGRRGGDPAAEPGARPEPKRGGGKRAAPAEPRRGGGAKGGAKGGARKAGPKRGGRRRRSRR